MTLHSSRRSGITALELLVVLAIIGIIGSFLTVFFTQSTAIAQRTQARNDVAIKVRTVAELVAQDLQLAGSRALVTNSGTVDPTVNRCAALTSPHCILGSDTNAGSDQDFVQVRYASSLRRDLDDTAVDERCRQVSYSFDPAEPNTLFRTDHACSATNINSVVFAENITVFDITYLCADYDPTDPSAVPVHRPADCYDPTRASFPRQAIITIAGQPDSSPRGKPITAEVTLTTLMPNLKDR